MVREREQIALRPKRDREREPELLATVTEVKDPSREKKEQWETTKVLTEALVKHDKARLEWVISQERENHKKNLAKAKKREEQQRQARMRDISFLVFL